MKPKIYMIGNFGYENNSLNGQTIRTRTIYESLEKYAPEIHVFYTDTSVVKNKIISIKTLNEIVKILRFYCSSDVILLLPANKMIKYLCPIVYYLNNVFKKEIHYIAIGGWLDDFLNEKPQYKKYFLKMNGIYVQTETLKNRLTEKSIANVVYFPNFRLYKENKILTSEVKSVKNVVYFARVLKEKGIELAIKAIEDYNDKFNDNLILSIYGQIENKYEETFNKLLRENINSTYKGFIKPENVLHVLSKYDIMLFPTYYSGEGFPGTILDAFSAGVPIIASDWKYNSEVLKDGYTGFLFKTNNEDELMRKLECLVDNTALLNQMKINCLEEAKKYESSSIISTLIERLAIPVTDC